MKKLLVVCILFIGAGVTAQNKSLALNTAKTGGVFQFDTEVVDYGTIQQNSNGKRSFTFKNTGNEPIVISKVKGSCGCTVVTKPNEPIMPGQTAEIGVKYATSIIGNFSKSITITSNASESVKVVKIKGKVLKNETKDIVKEKTLVSVQ